MREFIIQENDANQRLDKFISKAIPLLPKGLMYKSILWCNYSLKPKQNSLF